MSQSYKVPFYPQIWDLEKWHDLGFKSRDEAIYWQNSSCGILCLKMAIEGITGSEIDSISEIIQKGETLGAYSHAHGWSHQGLSNISRQYGIHGIVQEKMTHNDMVKFLDQGALPIVSIKWAFENKKTLKERFMFWKKDGGHLALVIGYEKDKGFYVHHTSITEGFNWENKLIPFADFNQAFTGRGIILFSI
jgi:hypothetical protein